MREARLKGRRVKFLDRERGFTRYGVIRGTRRVRDEPRVTAKGKRVKRPTVSGFRVEIPGGKVLGVREADVRAVLRYGKEVPVEEFVRRKQDGENGN